MNYFAEKIRLISDLSKIDFIFFIIFVNFDKKQKNAVYKKSKWFYESITITKKCANN